MVFHRIAGIVAVGALAGALIAYAAWPREFQRATVPGAITNATTAQICRPGYSASVRPAEAITEAIKHNMMAHQHPTERYSAYQLDHAAPLCLAGSPINPDNIWLQPIGEAHLKDKLEALLCRKVCAGEVSLEQAQHDIMTDWTAAYRKYMP